MLSNHKHYGILAMMLLALFGLLTFMGFAAYQWATNGEAWFTVFDHSFHKVSFLVGVTVGAIFLGGSHHHHGGSS